MRGTGKAEGTEPIQSKRTLRGRERERGGGEEERNDGRGNMLELIQFSAACRELQYRDIVPVCGGSAGTCRG